MDLSALGYYSITIIDSMDITFERRAVSTMRSIRNTSAQAFLVLAMLLFCSQVAGFAGPATSFRTMQAQTTELYMTEGEELPLSSRRSWLSGTGLAASALLAQTAFPGIASAVDKLEMVEDLNLNFQIKVPSDWIKQVQTLPDRRKIILFVDPTSDKDKSLMFFAFTPVRDDFTSLSSFGSVDQVSVPFHYRSNSLPS